MKNKVKYICLLWNSAFLLFSQISNAVTVEEASHRLSPVMRYISIPQPIEAGDTFDIHWDIMGYHGEMDSIVQFRCMSEFGQEERFAVADTTPVNIGQGWRWDTAYSNIYNFQAQMTLPKTLPLQDCEVRFYWRKTGAVDFYGVFLSVLIPGGVDTMTVGSEGRKIKRTVLESSDGSFVGTVDYGGITYSTSYVSMDMASKRLSPVLLSLNLPDYLVRGESYPVTWKILGYHGDIASTIRIKCGDDVVVREEDSSPQVTDGYYSWDDAKSQVYEFETDITIPFGSPVGDCEVRFYWSRTGYTDYYGANLSVLIPGGVDARTLGDAGRQLERTIAHSCHEFEWAVYAMPAAEDSIVNILHSGCELVSDAPCAEHTYAVVRAKRLTWPEGSRSTGGDELWSYGKSMDYCSGEEHEKFAESFISCDPGMYGIDAVCHQATNKAIIHSGQTLAGLGVEGYGTSVALYGTYGYGVDNVEQMSLPNPNPVQACFDESMLLYPDAFDGSEL